VSIGTSTPRLVVAVTGLAIEARIASDPGVHAVAGGGDARRLAAALESEIARGANAVISFGIAGGLVEDAVPGMWLIASAIVTPASRWQCDAAWAGSLAKRLRGALITELAGVDAPIADPVAKRALHRATGATAVDTESHIAAEIAAAHGLAFAAFRVIADPARRRLPAATAVALEPNGRINRAAILGSLARRPSQLPLLVRTAIDARIAFRALSRGRRLLGPGLGYPDLGELFVDVT
jgi:adenosylhomocysteine nucleosidase